MIKNPKYTAIHGRDQEVINSIIESKRTFKNYRVIDIGASMNSWCADHVDATIDILDYESNKPHFKGNINNFDLWKDVINYVDSNGKFDFSICTHTLEDISNPMLVSEMISRISNSGFIAVPSKYSECCRHGTLFRGWIHHRWIFNYENDCVLAYPKLPFTEYLDYLNITTSHNIENDEFSFFWEESCDIKAINNDYFPSGEYMVEIYRKLID